MALDLSGKRILVVGLGATGMATIRFLAHRGAKVVATDDKPLAALADRVAEIDALQADVAVAPFEPGLLSGIDWVVPSPGVPPAHGTLQAALSRKIPILSELELAYRFLRSPMIAITGTNGKTTTTMLVGEILKKSGMRVFVGGNIGTPLIAYVDGPQTDDYAVVEVSSFQLQWIEQFHPFVAVLLNVTSDHVDYHGSFAAYRAAKERIFENQGRSDVAILNGDDPGSAPIEKRIAASIRLFSTRRVVTPGISLEDDRLVYRGAAGEREDYPLGMIKIPGTHNVENVMAAILAARSCACPPAAVTDAVGAFRGISHRIEFAGEKGGVAFYDDSKGTNVGAVARALETFAQPIVLLMGGRDKEGDFESLAEAIRQRVKALVLFGEARRRIDGLVGGIVPTVLVETMGEAVPLARKLAAPGDVVLLSPGCASFDEFRDYKDRGKAFKGYVEGLAHV